MLPCPELLSENRLYRKTTIKIGPQHDRYIRSNRNRPGVDHDSDSGMSPHQNCSWPKLAYVVSHAGVKTRACRNHLVSNDDQRETTMNTTTFTIESVHGIKQTIVLVPGNQNQLVSETSAPKLTSDAKGQHDEEERSRLSK